MDETLRVLLGKQVCTELVYKLARGLDRLDAELLRSVFHPDATDDHGLFKGGSEDYIRWCMEALPKMDRTQHAICNILIEVRGDEARGESYAIATHDLRDEDGREIKLTNGMRYLDTFERRDGVWKIARRFATMEWQTLQPRTDSFKRDASDPHHFGERDRNDPVYEHFAALRR